MQKSWIILRKSISIVIDNFGQALRISGAIFVLSVFAATALNVIMTGSLIVKMPVIDPAVQPTPEQQAEIARNTFTILAGSMIFFVAMSWIAVAWHRYVLLEEDTNQLFPHWNSGRVFGYIWKTLLVGISIGLLIVFPFILVSSVIGAAGLQGLLPLLGLGMFICFYYMFFRMGLALPALAVDQKMNLKAAFQDTKELSNEIWGLAAMVVTLTVFVSVLIGLIAPNNILGVLITSVFQWFMVMISASLLTTLYGHAIERRPL